MSFSQDVKNEILAHIPSDKKCQSSDKLANKARLQRAFLEFGSVTNPDKSYHLEFVHDDEEELLALLNILMEYDIQAKITMRKGKYILYVKEGQSIVDLLNVMGAHKCLMDMENTIIMKDFRNGLNRKVNCETANLIKSTNASNKQVADILYLQKEIGLKNLPDNLREMAELRLDNPDASLKELCELMDPPLGKSGVNHRLRKLSEMAAELRGE